MDKTRAIHKKIMAAQESLIAVRRDSQEEMESCSKCLLIWCTWARHEGIENMLDGGQVKRLRSKAGLGKGQSGIETMVASVAQLGNPYANSMGQQLP
jgi:hypothetical protein